MAARIYTLLNKLANNLSLDALHPIGEVYVTSSASFDPNVVFGGVWSKVPADKILKIGTSSAGTTGGSGTSGAASGNTGGTAISISQMPSHRHYIYGWAAIWDGEGDFIALGCNYDSTSTYAATANAGGGAAHSHTLNSHTHTVNPPYYTVIAWVRTS